MGHVLYMCTTYVSHKNNYNKMVLVVVRWVRVKVREWLDCIYINRGMHLYHLLRLWLGLGIRITVWGWVRLECIFINRGGIHSYYFLRVRVNGCWHRAGLNTRCKELGNLG